MAPDNSSLNRNEDAYLDQWLDRALQHYGDIEPRAGLEMRILANLASEERKQVQGRAWIAASVCVAVAVIVAAVLIVGLHLHQSGVAKVPVNAVPLAAAHNSGDQHSSVAKVIKPQRRNRGTRAAVSSMLPTPMLPQFPSRRPLSEQERLLQEYVTQFPDQARLVARQQAETELEMEQLYAENARSRNSQ
jgi:hypothetical protein